MLSALPPDFHDTRNGSHLLVWGELGQWLVVDDDLYAFLRLLDGRRTFEEAVLAHARGNELRAAQALPEARQAVAELRNRGIVRDGSKAPAQAQEGTRLANVTFNITNRCNLRCAWCYNAGRLSEEMDVDEVFNAIAGAERLIARDATFIVLGGEPFLEPPRLIRTVARAEALFSSPILVSTNGTLVTREIAAALKGYRVEVQVSLDAATAAEHDAIRGEDVYERAVEGVRWLVEAGVYTVLSKVYTRAGNHGFEAYLDLARGLGVNEARFIPMRRLGRGAQVDAAPDQLVAFRELAGVLQRRPELRPLLRRDYFSILFEMCRRSSRRGGCGIGQQVVFIDADGSVYPCPNHVRPEHCCGNLREGSLADIVESSPVFAAMARTYRIERYTRCSACAFRRWCAGDCRGETLAVTGDPLAPSPHCEALRALIPEVLWMIAENDPRFGAPGAATSTFLT
jgi:radical SAM protein with 4Fe4S-binding SPASM domain